MTTETREQLQLKAEFYLCLAQAFHTPTTADQFDAMHDLLAADLEDLNGELRYDLTHPLAAYRDAVSQHSAISLLKLYSRLFLMPPMLARTNAAAYLDGGALGATVQALEYLYRRCGVERAESFHDQADHIAVQLEFVAYLYARAAGGDEPPVSAEEFLAAFPARWLPRLLADLLRAGHDSGGANVYLAMVQILRAAVDADAREAPPEDAREARRQRALEKARAKRAARDVSAVELAGIAAKLRAAGLSTAHLPDARVPHQEPERANASPCSRST